jgi:hypothetical protein
VLLLDSASYDVHDPGVGVELAVALGVAVAAGVGVPVAAGVGVCAKIVEEMRTNPKSDAKTHRTTKHFVRNG